MSDIKDRSGKVKTKSVIGRSGLEDTNPGIYNAKAASDAAASSTEIDGSGLRARNLEALLEVSKAINSTLDLDEILRRVMLRAVELLSAERGFLMLLDDAGNLQIRTAHNINKDSLSSAEDLKISRSVADRVALKGQSEYTSNAQEDPRYAGSKSVVALDLRFIVCVPLKIKDKVIGVCYLDNQSRAGLFGRSHLHLFELFAEQAAIAIENAKLYGRLLSLTRYNENVVNKTPVGLCVVDDQLRVLTFNLAAEAIFHSPDASWTGAHLVAEHTPFLDILPAAEREHWREMLQDVTRTHKPLTKEKYFLTIGGREAVLSIKISLLNGIVGEPPKIIIVAEDNTERVTLEKFVVHSEKMVAKAETVAAIAHEMNNHLLSMSAHAELMPIHLKGNKMDRLADSCGKIQDAIDNMARFTRSLTDNSQFETELVEVNVKDLIEENLFSIRPVRVFQQVRFATEFESNLPPVKLDAGQINSVLLNLYKNAAEAAVEGRVCEIRVRARHLAHEHMLELAIQDNGPGIPAEVLADLFTTRRTTKKGGHGLGLMNCRMIVQNHGGTIEAASASGKGTTFTVRLPVHRPFRSFES